MTCAALLAGCVESNDLPAVDAQSEISAAIAYKEGSCGNRPPFILIVPPQPSQYGVELCSISIIRLECPFDSYPFYCLELYGVDIPGLGP